MDSEVEIVKSGEEESLPVEGIKEDKRERELREGDLTRKKLYRVVSEAMDAEEVLVDVDGKEIGRTADHEVRLKAAREAREILGETAIPSKGRVMPNIVVFLSNGKEIK